MKLIVTLYTLLLTTISFGQENQKKPMQIQFEDFLINKETKTGYLRRRSPMSLIVLEEKDLEKFKKNQTFSLNPKNCNLNFKISSEGKFYFVKGNIGIKRLSAPEELRGIPPFDYEYFNDQEFIDFLNSQLSKLNVNYVIIQNGIEMTNFDELSDITFVRSFYFQTKKSD
ncbi:hypothetical protein NAT51_01905 [Flavobacterium amniphilum]|uniref:hypothetical protein n=1 Tax=Flavobacterium amniphilum TaxID=1834035 RepID=UPI002029EE27|nr:hypothetical protein [Flavobacterium amniphilum]MCL9804261.1 hypothetical protein [Flavobacterium amniphilum]